MYVAKKWNNVFLKVGLAALLLLLGALAFFGVSSQQAFASKVDTSFYQQSNLVSDLSGKARVRDAHLVNPWGIAFGPRTPFWISDNGTGVSTVYDSRGRRVPLVVTIPSAAGSSATAAPTGIVFKRLS